MGKSKLDVTYNVMTKMKPKVTKSKEVRTRGVVKSDMKPMAYCW